MIAWWLAACTSGTLFIPGEGPPPAPPPDPPPPPRTVSVEVVTGPAGPSVSSEEAPPAPAGAELAAELFSDEALPEFDVLLTEESLRSLRQDPYVYVRGALEYRGVRYQPVGVRVKGQNSFLPIDEKPSLKIKLDEYVPGLELLGLRELTLNNMSSDPSMMHERVAYRMYREQGVPAARATHAWVRINGEDRGLYAHVESVDDRLLGLWYDDPSGSMWELWDTDFTDSGIRRFEHEEGEDDRTWLQGTADALELEPRIRWLATTAWVDADQFLDFTAVSAIVGQFDSYPWRTPGDDCHVHLDPDRRLLHFLPHGLDETFTDPRRDFTEGDGLVLAACLGDRACAADYEARLWEVQLRSEEVDLLGYAEQVQAQIRPWVEVDPRRPYRLEEVRGAQRQMLDFIAYRPARLEEFVGPRP